MSHGANQTGGSRKNILKLILKIVRVKRFKLKKFNIK
mgnify:CR=1 FL=1